MSRKTITDQLRQAIRKAEAGGMGRREIARAAGVSPALITRFMSEPGKSIRFDSAEKIAKAIGKTLQLKT